MSESIYHITSHHVTLTRLERVGYRPRVVCICHSQSISVCVHRARLPRPGVRRAGDSNDIVDANNSAQTKLFLSKLLSIAPNVFESAIFMRDNGHGFDQVLFCGHEVNRSPRTKPQTANRHSHFISITTPQLTLFFFDFLLFNYVDFYTQRPVTTTTTTTTTTTPTHIPAV